MVIYCDSCGTSNSVSARFCKNCGASIDNLTTSPEISSSPSGMDISSEQNQSIGFGYRQTREDLILKCSLCSSQDFAKDSGRLDSKWGITSFKVIMLTCKRCGHIELFNKGRSIFDFD